MRLAPCLFIAAALLASSAVQAQRMRPGLWENSVTMKPVGGEMEAQMARMRQQMESMSPEQRRQVEAMMPQGMGMAGGKPMTTRTCVTAEQAARDQMDTGDGRCQQTSHSRSGNTVRFKFTCQGNELSGSGEGEFTLVSETEHRGRMLVEAQRKDQPARIEMTTAGRWVAADCGDVKPRR